MKYRHDTLDQRQSLRSLKELYRSLKGPGVDQIVGKYNARFIGPWWLRLSASPSIALAGLKGWCGKEFFSERRAINLVRYGGNVVQKVPMEIKEIVSFLDGKPTAACTYPKGTAFPWPYVIDEFRSLGDNTLLAMTIIDAPWLRRMAFPFLLYKQ